MDEIIDAEIVTPGGAGDAAHDVVVTDLACATNPATPAKKAAIVIEPRVGIRIREGTREDVAFIDRMQKAHSRELGFLPLMAIEGKIKLGQVLIAEVDSRQRAEDRKDEDSGHGAGSASSSSLSTALCPLPSSPIGYLIAADRYCRRDEIGYVTQINVLPEYRRHLVAAKLLQAQFDRSAYGCRLYGCWCAQDLKANEFWEAMGFTAIAFRTGSRTKGKDATGKSAPRIHLFWQKRIRPSDTTTPWWYPAKTEGGEMREDRLVFPIPAGVHWRHVLPIVLPETANAAIDGTTPPVLPSPASGAGTKRGTDKPKSRKEPAKPTAGLWFGGAPKATEDDRAARAEARAVARAEAKAAAAKVDPRLAALSRELRDRWAETAEFLLSSPGKYNLCRAIDRPVRRAVQSIDAAAAMRPALPAAA